MENKKRILIVGAQKGIGLGLAKEFFDRNYHVTATYLDDNSQLKDIGTKEPDRLFTEKVDINDPDSVAALDRFLGHQKFDILYFNAAIWGPEHQSVLQTTVEEATQIFMTNAISPVRMARVLMTRLPETGGMICFSTSLRGSITRNVEGRMDLYRASKAALNMLTRGLFADLHYTVLNIHPGWVNTDMGTLNGTVNYEIEIDTSVRGIADVIEQRFESDNFEHAFVDYQGKEIPW